MLEQSYERSARQETDDTAQFALMQIQTELENTINDSKSVSYDGVIRSAYLNYRENGNKITLYRSVNGYLLDSHFEPYASIVMMFKSSALLSPLSVLGSSEDIQLQLDGLSFVRSGEDGLIAEAERDGGYRYEATVDGPGLPGGSRDGQIELFVIYC